MFDPICNKIIGEINKTHGMIIKHSKRKDVHTFTIRVGDKNHKYKSDTDLNAFLETISIKTKSNTSVYDKVNLTRPDVPRLINELVDRGWIDTTHPMVISVYYGSKTFIVERSYRPEFGKAGFLFGFDLYDIGLIKDLSNIPSKKTLIKSTPNVEELLNFLKKPA